MKLNKLFIVFFILLFSFDMRSDTAVDFKLPNLKNEQVQFSDFLNKGPIVLDFWATWCKPCHKAFPKFNDLYEKYHEQGLEIIGINEDGPRSQAKIKPFVRSLKIKFPILIDNNNAVMRRFQVQSLPTTILISPDGKIVKRYTGFHVDEMKELEKHVIELLDKRTQKKGEDEK